MTVYESYRYVLISYHMLAHSIIYSIQLAVATFDSRVQKLCFKKTVTTCVFFSKVLYVYYARKSIIVPNFITLHENRIHNTMIYIIYNAHAALRYAALLCVYLI